MKRNDRNASLTLLCVALGLLTSCDRQPAPTTTTSNAAPPAVVSPEPGDDEPGPSSDPRPVPEAEGEARPSSPAASGEAKVFKTPQECFESYVPFKGQPQVGYEQYFACVTKTKAAFEVGTKALLMETMANAGELDNDAFSKHMAKHGLGKVEINATIRAEATTGIAMTEVLARIGRSVVDKIAFLRESDLLLAPHARKLSIMSRPMSHLTLAHVEIDGEQAIGELVDPKEEIILPGDEYFIFEDGSWKVALGGVDWKGKITPEEQAAVDQLNKVGKVHINLLGRKPIFGFECSDPNAGDAELAPLVALPTIEQIHIQGTAITDDFGATVAKHKRYVFIIANDTKLTDAFLKHFADFEKIDIRARNTNISKAAAKEFTEGRPDRSVDLGEK